ncbi:dCTP deaminase [Mycoplasmatota bacterium WC44]
MILTGKEIEKNVRNGKIVIKPYNSDFVNPNSYNFRIGNTLKVYKNDILDPKVKQEVDLIEITEKGYTLAPNRIYLVNTFEIIGSNYYVPIIRARSSTARLGLFVHVTADLIDIGYINQFTLQLHAVQPVQIYPGMPIGQVTFWIPKGEVVLYDGKYKSGRGPQESKIYMDF